ncbi:hypothetical protein ACFWDI_26425 [Streptomyces sp. NPDC060064]|uniref:hypothetical protein n=1 Tax=Streptomyces sp. NPDC060064 TaxID=3347049 RepID=UPI00367A8436
MTEIPAQRGGPPRNEIFLEAFTAVRPEALTSLDFQGLKEDDKKYVIQEAAVYVLDSLDEASDVAEVAKLLTEQIEVQAKNLRREEKRRRRKEYRTTDFDRYLQRDDRGDELPDDGIPESVRKFAPADTKALWTVLRKHFKGRQLSILEMQYAGPDGPVSEAEMAKTLGVSRRTIRTALVRAVKKFDRLKDDLRHLGEKADHLDDQQQ